MLLTPTILADSSLFLVLYRMSERWLGQYVVVRLRITLGEKGYNCCFCSTLLFFVVVAFVSSLFLGSGGRQAALRLRNNPYFPVKLQSLMIAAIPNIIGWLAISFARVNLSCFSGFATTFDFFADPGS